MEEQTTVVIPDAAKETLRAAVSQRQAVEQGLQNYVRGLRDALHVEGNWNLNLDAMIFEKEE